MKAQLALIAAGAMRMTGSMPIAIAVAPRIGIISAVKAVLLVISVRKVVSKQTKPTITGIGIPRMPVRLPAMTSLNPVDLNACANAMPPPNRRSTPQGIVRAWAQSSNRAPRPSGNANSATTTSAATVADPEPRASMAPADARRSRPVHPPPPSSRPRDVNQSIGIAGYF